VRGVSRERVSVVLVLATLAVVANLCAQAATDFVAARLVKAGAAAMTARARDVVRGPGDERPDVNAILARNIFEAAAVRPAQEEGAESARARRGEARACAGSLRLVAAVFSQRTGARSLASIASGRDAPKLYRKGSWVQGKQVVAVTPRAVELRARDGRTCSLRLFEAEQADQVTEESVPEPGISQRELAENIEGNGRRFAMQRAFVERALQQQSEIVQGVRAVLHRENGRALGVKLYGIRGGGLFARLGLQNGDVLRTINGFDLSTPDSALDAYAKLRSARHVSLALMRGGRNVTLDYTIRE